MTAIALIVRFEGGGDVRRRLAAMQQVMPGDPDAVTKLWISPRGGLAVRSARSEVEGASACCGSESVEGGPLVAALQGVLTEIASAGAVENGGRFGHGGLDARALLAAYERHGADAFARCYGHFAALLWNRQSGQVALAVDHVAHQPLFYSLTAKELVVASLPHAVALGREDGCRIDLVELGRRLLPCFPRAGATLFEGVRRVEPGCCLTVSDRGVEHRRYWQPETLPLIDGRACPDDLRDEFRARLRRAVASFGGTETSGKVGLLLSGGLDSSAIATAAATVPGIGPSRLTATACWPSQSAHLHDDPRLASMVAKQLKFPLLPICDGANPEEALDGFFRGTGSLPGDVFYAARAGLYAHLRSQGAGLVLDGEGGETAATSHTRGWHAELLRTLQVRRLLRELQATRRGAQASWGALLADVLKPLVSDRLLQCAGVRRSACSWPDLVGRAGFHPDYAQFLFKAGLPGQVESAITAPSFWFPRPHPSVRANDLESLRLLPPDLGLAGGGFGVAVRHPLLDRRLMEWVWTLPSAARAGEGVERRLVRESLRGLLPVRVVERRSKGPFFPDYERWVLQHFGNSAEGNSRRSRQAGLGLFADGPASFLDGPEPSVLSVHQEHRRWMVRRFVAWVAGLKAGWSPKMASPQATVQFLDSTERDHLLLVQ